MTTCPELTFDRRRYRFRSRAVFAFLDTLRRAAEQPGSAWVDLATMQQAMPGQGPRQFARYVDMLREAGLPLLKCETKTRGRWRLAVPVGALSIRTGATASPCELPHSSSADLSELAAPAWVEWVVLLAQADMAIQEGSLEDASRRLKDAERVALALPLWAGSIVLARIIHVLLRRASYREASQRLRRLETMCRHGSAARAAADALPLLRAKFHYDRGRLREAQHAMAGITAAARELEDAHALNMRALIAGRRFWANPDEGQADLALALESWLRAFGAAFLRGETTLLDPLCYNMANNLLRGVARGVLPAVTADTALRWLATDTALCRKLGIGGDSILADLLLIDAGLKHGYMPASWPAALRDDFNLPPTLDGILAKILDQARRADTPFEVALCLKRKVLLARNRTISRNAFDEADGLLRDIGNADELRSLRAAWRSRWH